MITNSWIVHIENYYERYLNKHGLCSFSDEEEPENRERRKVVEKQLYNQREAVRAGGSPTSRLYSIRKLE